MQSIQRTAATIPLFIAKGTGTLKTWTISSVGANTSTRVVTVDLKKNGTTVLSGIPDLDAADAAYAKQTGTFSNTAVVSGDVFTMVITIAGSGTLATEVMGQVEVDYNGA